jgi:hypothetical protein
MTAIAAAVNRQHKGTFKQRGYLMTATTTIPKGALVAVDATTGLAKNAATGVAADTVVGVALETITSAAAGSYFVQVGYDTSWLFACTASITQGTVGDTMYITDNNTVTLTSTTAAIVGKLEQFISGTLGWVYVQGASVAA